MKPSTLYAIGWIGVQTGDRGLTLSDIIDYLLHTPIRELAAFVGGAVMLIILLIIGVTILIAILAVIWLALWYVLMVIQDKLRSILGSWSFIETMGRMGYKAGRAYRHFRNQPHRSPRGDQ